jgi:putative tryptophan/tyrosine transport system substrate-binding protein
MAPLRLVSIILVLIGSACAPAAPTQPTAAPAAAAAAAKTFRVGISQFFSHPVIDDYREGFKQGMAKAGLVEGQNVTYDVQNAQFNMDTLRSIAQKFQADRVDMVFSMTTPATLATLNVINDTPVVFGLATDAKAAGIVKDTAKPDRNATGVESYWPPDKHLEAMRKVLPNAKRLGVAYNSGEANSRVQMDGYKAVAPQYGFEFAEANVTSTNDVQQAVQSLVGRSDALLIIGDNTVQGAIGAVLKVGFENKLPVLSVDPENAKEGVLAGWGILQKDTGAQAGELAARILKGARVADTPVEKPRKYWFTINTAAAQQLGLIIPADTLKQADTTYDTLTTP